MHTVCVQRKHCIVRRYSIQMLFSPIWVIWKIAKEGCKDPTLMLCIFGDYSTVFSMRSRYHFVCTTYNDGCDVFCYSTVRASSQKQNVRMQTWTCGGRETEKGVHAILEWWMKREMYVVTAHVVTMPTIIIIIFVHICFVRMNCQVIVIFILIFCVRLDCNAFCIFHFIIRSASQSKERERKKRKWLAPTEKLYGNVLLWIETNSKRLYLCYKCWSL